MAMLSLWANTAVARSPPASARPISRLPSSNTALLAGGTAHASSPSSAAASAKASLRSANGWMSGGPGSWTTRRWPSSARCAAASLAPPRSSWVTAGTPEPGRLRTASTTGTREAQPSTLVQIARAHGQQHQPVHLAGQEVPDRPLQHLGVVHRLGHQGHVVGALEAALEAAHDRGGVGVPEVGDHHPDGGAEPPAQPPGHHVVLVPELLGHPLDPRAGLRGHRVRCLRVQRPRRRGHMHLGRRGHVPQRDRPPNELVARHPPRPPPALGRRSYVRRPRPVSP